MFKQLKKDNKGFTIIEVLIVLAIAGLLMLIVFLAVPALQRNSRNTTRRNDVSVYLGAVSEWMANNNGKVPLTADLAALNPLANTSATMTKPAAIVTGARTNAANALTMDTLEFVTGAKCDTATVGNTVAASGRSYAIRFAVESSAGAVVPQCQEG